MRRLVMDEWQIAEKIAKEMEFDDPGYIYYNLIELQEGYQEKYPGHRMLCLPGLDLAVMPDGTTDVPANVFKEDYPSCRGMTLDGGCGG